MTQKFVISDDEIAALTHSYCRDYTALAQTGRYGPVIGRDAEIRDMILILLQKNRKNVCLLAPAGVGKTTLVIGLAQAIVNGAIPDYLQDGRVLELDLAAMAAGTGSTAEFQERFIPLCRGLAERYHAPDLPRTILFIDEIHTIMPSVPGSSYAGLSETLKPYLTVGDLHVIGATTRDEHRLFMEKDTALDRRFQKIHLSIPTAEETLAILEALRSDFEQHFKIEIPQACLEEVIRLTEKHMPKRNQPDKSVMSLDAACAHHVMENGTGTALTLDSVQYMAARETGIHKDALDDRKKR